MSREIATDGPCPTWAGGFEPPYGGIKIHFLSTWRRPNRPAGKRGPMRGDRLREAIQLSAKQVWIASSLSLLAMTNSTRKTARRANQFVFCEVACPAPLRKIFWFAPEPNQFTDSRR